MSVELSGKGQERRTARREPISRRVVFAGVRGEGLLRQGMAVDISASGLLVHTSQPDLAGRHLELELHPDGAAEPGDVIMVRGEVVWTRPLQGRGDYAMGVRFLQSFPATDMTGAGYRPATRDESAELAASIQRRLAAMEPAVRVEISDAARRKGAAEAQDGLPDPDTTRRRSYRWLWLLLLMLCFGATVSTLTMLALWRLGFYEQSPGTTSIQTPRPTPASISVPAAVPTAKASGDSPGADPSARINARIEHILESGPSYYLNRGSLFLIQGRFPAAAQAFNTAQSRPEGTPLERFIAELGEAQALAGEGDTDEALNILKRPWEEAQAIPESWRALRQEFLAALSASPDSPEAQAPLVNAFAFQPPEKTAEEGGADPSAARMRIEIDTTRHILSVLDNNAIRAVYPIGLGAPGKTPEGEFEIVNKIEDPEWYNRGNPIPAGAPGNELGSRWIGLGDASGPTPLGIHATDDLASIGANMSRGCIRMRPADVEELFTFVEVGTPVSIRAL
ncbi:MAG: L,D-transpeptidase family protein [Candidatus Hydrogenedentes bacterium]|nr:L,D-transpeptidase family protein [Candidatus Hydrogenedentota bacterium]